MPLTSSCLKQLRMLCIPPALASAATRSGYQAPGSDPAFLQVAELWGLTLS